MDLHYKYDKLTFRDRIQVRNEYVKRQQGKCYWCGYDLEAPPAEDIEKLDVDWGLFPEGFQNFPVHLQHDHGHGWTEGAVHMKCNAVMWQYHRR